MRRWLTVFAVPVFLLGILLASSPVKASGYFSVYTTTPHPAQYTNAVVWVELYDDADGFFPQVGLPVHTVWNYRTTTSYTDWYTDGNGKAAMIRNISGATCGYTVRVDIYVGYDQVQIDSVYFTPCYG